MAIQNAVDIIALIFATGIVVKLAIVLFAKSSMQKIFDWWMKKRNLALATYIIGILILGYYILFNEATKMSIVQVTAAEMFILYLIGLTLMSSDKSATKKMGKKMISKSEKHLLHRFCGWF